ncbi:MAG: hypothetical protein ACXABY_19150 [Candidatus Thorarchaeota archaeon]|jgi:hypothetical protein
MTLAYQHDSQDSIPEGLREHYAQVEETGPWFLDVTGITLPEEVAGLRSALAGSRRVEGKQKKDLAAFGEHTPDTIKTMVEELDELKAQLEVHDDAGNEEKFQEAVEKRLKRKIGPLQRENDGLKTRITELETSISGLTSGIDKRDIRDNVRAALVEGKVESTAMDDALMLAEQHFEKSDDGGIVTKSEGVGTLTPGMDAKAWLEEMRPKRPHWWPKDVSADAESGKKGADGKVKNPWRADSWNLREQTRITNENPEQAEALMQQAGHKGSGASTRMPI